jgi:hypothetical protein
MFLNLLAKPHIPQDPEIPRFSRSEISLHLDKSHCVIVAFCTRPACTETLIGKDV